MVSVRTSQKGVKNLYLYLIIRNNELTKILSIIQFSSFYIVYKNNWICT